jgi:hypothetical protein
MSHFTRVDQSSGLGALYATINATLSKQAAVVANDVTARAVAGLESAAIGAHRDTHKNIENMLSQCVTSVPSVAAPTCHGLEAAAILVAASSNPSVYHDAVRGAQNIHAKLREFGPLGSGNAGALSYSTGTESFDTQELAKHTVQSITYTIDAVRQDALGELFFPTIVATPDQAFYKASVVRPTIFRGITHSRDGNPTKWEKYNLLDAYRDASLLKNDSTRLIPYASSEAVDNLAPVSEIATVNVKVGDWTVPSRPLKMGKKINLIGISMHPDLVANGVCDQTDHIDRAARVEALYVKVTKTGNAAPAEIIKFNVLGMPSSNFYKTQEGKGYDAMLKMTLRSLRLDKNTKSISGAVPAMLADFVAANLAVDLETVVDGELNFEQGTANVRGSHLTPRAIYDVSSDLATQLTTHASLENLVFEPVYWDIDAHLTNTNRRTRGTMLDNDVFEEIYTIGLLAPISVQKPVHLTDKSAVTEVETDTLVKATHVIISNSAVTTLLNYCEHLKSFYHKNINHLRAASIDGEGIEGIGRLLVTPFYAEAEIDLVEVINSLTSTDKMSDLRGYFTGFITELGYRMAQRSGYLPVLRQYTNNPEATPTLLIGTDQVLPQFMMINGDPRAVGPTLKHEIASSPDDRMVGEIILSFGKVDDKNFCPLNSGNMIWIPEWISTIPVNRGGATVNETCVQPRFRHVINLPIFARIKVTNLDKYLGTKMNIAYKEVV